MLEWYWVVLITVYALGFAALAAIFLAFDGWSWGGGGQKSGVLSCLLGAATWPLLVPLVVIVGFHDILKDARYQRELEAAEKKRQD